MSEKKENGTVEQVDLLQVLSEKDEQISALEKKIADNEATIAGLEEKLKATVKEAEEVIGSISVELDQTKKAKNFVKPVVKIGKESFELKSPTFNLNGKDYVSADIADNDPVLTELKELGSGILVKIK